MMRHHSRIDIRLWKKLLLNKDEIKKMKAAEQILQNLNKLKDSNQIENVLKKMIDEDFVDIICSSMQTWNFKLMRNMYLILQYFLKIRKFFEYYRIVLVSDTLIRNIEMLHGKKKSSTVMSIGILTSIITRSRLHSLKNVCNLKALLRMLVNLNKKLEYFADVEYNIYNLTYFLLCEAFENSQQHLNMDTLKSLTIEAIVSLCKEIGSGEPNEQKQLKADLMCKLMTKVLRCFEFDGMKELLIKSCISIASFAKIEKNLKLGIQICKFFTTIANGFGVEHFHRFAKFIAGNGFLMFFLHYFQACRNNIEAKKIFSEILQLSVNAVSKSHGQKEDMGKLIQEGLFKIPDNSTCALELEKPNFTTMKAAIIVILYYHYSLCTSGLDGKLTISSGSPVMNKVILKEITLLKQFMYLTKSAPRFIMRMLIFIYALSSKNSRMTSKERMQHKGYKNLVDLINSTQQPDELYSDHNIMIQWIFSPSCEKISNAFKSCMISKWISFRKGGEYSLLENIIEINPDALSLIIVMLCSCEEDMLGPLLYILKKLQTKNKSRKDNILKLKIWRNIIRVFEYYCENPQKGQNLAAFLKLASVDCPSLKVNYMILVTNKLLKVMQNQTYISHSNSLLIISLFSLIKTLMTYFISKAEERGMFIFFKTRVLTSILRKTIFHENKDLASASAELITFISKVQHANRVESDENVKISLDTLTKESTRSMVSSFNCVMLYLSFSKIATLKPFIAIEIMPDENRQQLCHKLYMNFLNISFMINETGGKIYWGCMEQLIQNADTEEGSQAFHVWTACTISLLLAQSGSQLPSKQMLLFFKAWLTRLTPAVFRWSHSRHIYRTLLRQIEDTAITLACKAINDCALKIPDSRERKSCIKIYKSLALLILNLQVNLPVDSVEQLNKMNNSLESAS